MGSPLVHGTRDGMSKENMAVIDAAYAFVEKKPEARHIAGLIGHLYNVPKMYDFCPAAAPRSGICGDRYVIPARYNNPSGRKALNSVLRYAYNYFFSFVGPLYDDEVEMRATTIGATWRKRADAICFALKDAFNTLAKADDSKTKDREASSLFHLISGYVLVPPSTRQEERERWAAEGEARLRRIAEEEAARKAAAAAVAAAKPAEDEVW
jgi:hypothetical protein